MCELFDRPVNLFQDRLPVPRTKSRKPDAQNPNYQLRYSNALMQFCNGSARRVVDVGANQGLMTDRYAAWAKVVESFEPIPALCRSTWHQVALSDHTGTSEFFVCDDPALSRLTPGTSQANGHLITVPVTTLDSYGWTDVDAIKVDVEGFELEVLRGAEQTIRASWPVVQVELMPTSWGRQPKVQAVVDYMTELGYVGFDYRHMPLGTKWTKRPHDSDWFFKKS